VPSGPDSRFTRHDLAGVYYALVTQNDDPDGPGGRVKVRFPWLPEGDRDQSRWAAVAVPMVGAGFGTYVLPEVNDEVMVMFLAGDIDHPVVVGGGWSKSDPPPESNADGKNDFRLIKSRSGHRMLFDDSEQGKLVMTDRGDRHFIACGPHDAGGSGPNAFPVPSAPAVTASARRGVSVSALSGTLNLWCPDGTLSVSAPVIEVTGLDGCDVKGGQSLSLSTPGTASLGSGGAGGIAGGVLKLGAG
jgi:phage baseplate assembly protein gpV